MRLAILGGSFNPVHIGHLYLADSVLANFDYDRVILVPAFQSPFKQGAEGANPQDRLDMLAASIPGDTRFTIDDCEINREGVSYTIDTIKDIISRYRPEGKPALIIGDDLTSTFHLWQNADEIAQLADIIVARRLEEKNEDAFPYPHRNLNNEIMNISSRLVREKIAKGDAWRYLLPAAVPYIIENRSLYGYSVMPGKSIDKKIIVFLENEARMILDLSRFIHSRNTAIIAWDLAFRYGQDSEKAYIAGITHDLCKNLNDAELIRLAGKDGSGFSILERNKPGLLHGRAAAVQLRQKYGITDKEILDAVRYHTTGIKNMGSLAKIIYIADKTEVSRSDLDEVLKSLSYDVDLDTLFKAVLDNTVAQLKARQMDISYGTRKLLAAMEKKKK